MTGLNIISPSKLMRQIGLPDHPEIVDMRIANDIAADGRLTCGFVGGQDAPPPTLPIGLSHESGRWVTCQRPKIDRIACPWQIKRITDQEAEFMWGPRAGVVAVADQFHAVLETVGLHTKALNRMADVIWTADKKHRKNAQQPSGLVAFSLGFSELHRDDNALLDAGLSLYHRARGGFDEGHAE